MTIIAPLNIEYLFINTFAGRTLLFVGVTLLFIASLSAKFRMPIYVFGMMMVLFSVVIMSIAPWFYILANLMAALLIGYTITRMVKS